MTSLRALLASFSSRKRSRRLERVIGHPALVQIERLEARTLLSATFSAIERVSVSINGVEGNAASATPAVSSDGRFVAFESAASNLVPGDTNNRRDIFLADRETGEVRLVSAAVGGGPSNADSLDPSISDDGRFVAFQSFASNLVTGDTNNAADIFVFDRLTGIIERVSRAANGQQANNTSLDPVISGNGQFVAFASTADNLLSGADTLPTIFDQPNIFVFDRQTNTVEQVSNGGSDRRPDLSFDGRFVAFDSEAALVTEDLNLLRDVFVYDRQFDTTERVSVATDGTQGNAISFAASISDDGNLVAFESSASSLVANDTGGHSDIFVYDRLVDGIKRISVTDAGVQGNSDSTSASISGDGRSVAFRSNASNLVAGDTNAAPDVFVFDRASDTIQRVSLRQNLSQGLGSSSAPAVNKDGSFVAFVSAAALDADDLNGLNDIYIAGPDQPSFALVDFDRDNVLDLVYIKAAATPQERTELHVLNGATQYLSFSANLITALHVTGREAQFAMVDFNGDQQLDLAYIKKFGTASGKTELHVLDGASEFKRFLLHTSTVLHQTGDEADFVLVDFNKDGALDLAYIAKFKTGSGTTELHVLNGATGFQSFLVQQGTILHQTGDEADFDLTDFNRDGVLDLVYISKNGTGSGTTELHVLNGADGFQSFLRQQPTVLHETDEDAVLAFGDFSGDGVPDLVFISTQHTGTGTTELHVIDSLYNFLAFSRQQGTVLHETGPKRGDTDLLFADLQQLDETLFEGV